MFIKVFCHHHCCTNQHQMLGYLRLVQKLVGIHAAELHGHLIVDWENIERCIGKYSIISLITIGLNLN